jgi:hypothetical protein
MINLVQDRVTGEMYDPMVEFEKLLHHPDTVAQMFRMKEERGRGWPKHPDDRGDVND